MGTPSICSRKMSGSMSASEGNKMSESSGVDGQLFQSVADLPEGLSFKECTPFEERREESMRIRRRHEDRVPVVCEPLPTNTFAPINQQKFLFPREFTVGQTIAVLRKRLPADAQQASLGTLFIFAGGVMPSTSQTLNDVDARFCDEDGFLYLSYGEESTFG